MFLFYSLGGVLPDLAGFVWRPVKWLYSLEHPSALFNADNLNDAVIAI
jgi:hypothetical protein